MKNFTAIDGTEMVFDLVKSFEGCQKFKIMVKGQKDRSITLAEIDVRKHYKTLEILLSPGIEYFKSLKLYKI